MVLNRVLGKDKLVKDLLEEKDRRIEEKEKRIQELEEKSNSSFNSEISELKDQFEVIEQNKEKLFERLDEKNERIETLEKEKQSLMERIEHMEGLLDQARSKFEEEDSSRKYIDESYERQEIVDIVKQTIEENGGWINSGKLKEEVFEEVPEVGSTLYNRLMNNIQYMKNEGMIESSSNDKKDNTVDYIMS